MTFEMVRQGRDEACWVACVSALTGIDYDLFPHDADSQLVYRWYEWVSGYWLIDWCIDSGPNITDWNAALAGHYALTARTTRDPDLFPDSCIVIMAVYNSVTGEPKGSHAVVLKDGVVHDPVYQDEYDRGCEGATIHDLVAACNILVMGFITVEELNDG